MKDEETIKKEMAKLGRQIAGIVISVLALAAAWYFYDWKLAGILSLAIWGNNIEQKNS